jgi:hypothetical protein
MTSSTGSRLVDLARGDGRWLSTALVICPVFADGDPAVFFGDAR